MFRHNDPTATELIFLGTGTSSGIPHVDCLTYDPAIHIPCKTCLSTLRPEGKKNVRRNTGAVLRIKAKDGRTVYVSSLLHLLHWVIEAHTACQEHHKLTID